MPPAPLTTPRLLLLPLTRQLMERRLKADAFALKVLLPDGEISVHVSPEWPADLLPAFPFFLTLLGPQADAALFENYAAVHDGEIIGALGIKGEVSDTGEAEIGYGFNASAQGQGYATEAVAALCAHLLSLPEISTITAQTALGNRASERVLEKCGFARMGTLWSEEDGEVMRWQRH